MPPKLDTIIFCDDIRQETGNKLTLVGIYGSHVYLPKDAKFPAGMRQLCAYLRFSGVRGGEKLSLKVERETKVVYESPEPSELRAPNQEDEYSQVGLFLVPFGFESFGNYSFKFFWEKEALLVREVVLRVLPLP